MDTYVKQTATTKSKIKILYWKYIRWVNRNLMFYKNSKLCKYKKTKYIYIVIKLFSLDFRYYIKSYQTLKVDC